MLNRFKTGNFGVAVPARGIGVPMDADSNTIGRATYFGPTAFGPNIPQEVAARQSPPTPRYRDRVVTGGDLPPEVVSGNTGIFGRLFKRKNPRGGG